MSLLTQVDNNWSLCYRWVMEFFSKKKITVSLTLFITFILFFTLFGDRGVLKIIKLRRELQRLKQSVRTLGNENQELTLNIQKMKNESSFQERSARESLGMARENEIIYEFSDELGGLKPKINPQQKE